MHVGNGTAWREPSPGPYGATRKALAEEIRARRGESILAEREYLLAMAALDVVECEKARHEWLERKGYGGPQSPIGDAYRLTKELLIALNKALTATQDRAFLRQAADAVFEVRRSLDQHRLQEEDKDGGQPDHILTEESLLALTLFTFDHMVPQEASPTATATATGAAITEGGGYEGAC